MRIRLHLTRDGSRLLVRASSPESWSTCGIRRKVCARNARLRTLLESLAIRTILETPRWLGRFAMIDSKSQESGNYFMYVAAGMSTNTMGDTMRLKAVQVNDFIERLVEHALECGLTSREVTKQFRKRFLEVALDLNGGNQTKTAEALGLHRNVLARQMFVLGIPGARKAAHEKYRRSVVA